MLDLRMQGLLLWGLGRNRERRLGRESREEGWEDKPWLVASPGAMLAECRDQLRVGPGQRGLRSGEDFTLENCMGHLLHLCAGFQRRQRPESQCHSRGRNLSGSRQGRKALGSSCRAGRVDSLRKCWVAKLIAPPALSLACPPFPLGSLPISTGRAT